MIRALFTSATGMKAEELVVDVVANNLANVNTTGFKRSLVTFQDLLYLHPQPPGTEISPGQIVPTGLEVGSGVRPAATMKQFTLGGIEFTGNELDVAIEGNGFFQILMPDGTIRYTRAGQFRLDQNRRIVTPEGFPLEPAITIPEDATAISIGRDGRVSIVTSAAPETSTVVGTIQLALFPNPAGLKSEGHNLYSETPASGAPILVIPGESGAGTLLASFLERSNVEVVSELVNLILAQRAYEINSRAIRAGDAMLETVNQLPRG
jgi:flagellar basal-body rod protein FlgG